MLGDLVVALKVDSKGWKPALDRSSGDVKSWAAGMSTAIAGVATAFSAAIAAATTYSVKAAADAELTGIQFEVMLGSAEKAKGLLQELTDLGSNSPFGVIDVQTNARTLLGFGVAADEVSSSLSMLGDIAAGDAERFQRLSLAFAQATAAGRLQGQDVLQMVNAGFNPLQQISEKTGESMLDLRKRMEAGGISAQEMAEAFKAATSEGGRFFGMTAKINETASGQFMILKDQIQLTAIALGNELLPVAKDVLEWAVDMAPAAKNWAETFGQGIATVIDQLKALDAALGQLRGGGAGGNVEILPAFKVDGIAAQILGLKDGEIWRPFGELKEWLPQQDIVADFMQNAKVEVGKGVEQVGQELPRIFLNNRLQEAFNKGLLNAAQDAGQINADRIAFAKDLTKPFDKITSKDGLAVNSMRSSVQLASAVERGSQAAFQAVQRFRGGGPTAPEKQIAKNTQEMVVVAKQQLEEAKKNAPVVVKKF